MTQRDFERKQRFGIRKFTVGAASVVIGAVVFGASPVLAQKLQQPVVKQLDKLCQNCQKK